ncbi:MAG: FlgD immunoglobulin-like domain containing protein [Candidatus Cloacimonadaceae bacterium]|nr:FlgD immunoglobulin-like domain containing protein [Candidatus Cloacimonadaceae bacterium]
MKINRIPMNAIFPIISGWSPAHPVCLLICCLLFSLSFMRLPACAMSAVISMQGYTLDDFPPEGLASEYWRYDDPWDYIGFVMANSSRWSNNDGYGIVAYRDNDSNLPTRNTWYKRVFDINDFGNVYYTGLYLKPENQGTNWDYDILDTALFSIRNEYEHPAIVLCHARNATGITYGNHPFWFQHRGRTFTFMHNGYCEAARHFMINRINQMNPEWFARYPSNYFNEHNPLLWVDTEVLFHYIMSYVVISGNNFLAGIHNALSGIKPYLENPQTGVYNFIMSDGTNLYAFRSTPLTGANSYYRLSFKSFMDKFIAIRTQTPSAGDIVLRHQELVILTRNPKPQHFPDFTSAYLGSAPHDVGGTGIRNKLEDTSPTMLISPNPCTGSVTLQINLPSASTLVSTIYNIKGEAVWRAQLEIIAPGTATLIWDGTDDHGHKVSSGVYFVRTIVGSELLTGKIVLIK